MSLKYNLIFSVILTLLIITLKTINIIKNKTINKDSVLYKNEKKLTIIFLIISIIIFVFSFLNNKFYYKQDLLNNFLNSLSIFVLTLPLSINNLYNTYIKNEEKLCYTKTIITNKLISKKTLKKINNSHINVVTITEDNKKMNLPVYSKKELNIKLMRKNIVIKSKIYKDIISKYNYKQNFIYTTEPEKTYNNIINARGVFDNYLRSIKYILTTYIPIITSIIVINYIMQLPFTYSINLSLLTKLLTIIICHYLYKKLPFDTDIPRRKQRDKNIYLYKQEIILLIFQIFPIFVGISLPYTYFIAYGTSQTYANTTMFIIIIFINLFITFVNLSEDIMLKNFSQIIKNKFLVIYTILSISIIIFFNYIHIFYTEKLDIKNITGCIIVAFIFTVCYDIIKFARYTTTKGIKKYDSKNNKKYKRS